MNKLGMFIHWGPYAEYGLHEQALARHGLPHEEYQQKAMAFCPTEYNPEEWVLLAKNAGMKYICFTTKHHDGFCMWDTKYTDYNIMNTPYGKDVLKQLADACQKHGVLLSLYYSNPDWHHENAYNPNSTHQWACRNTEKSDLTAYRKFIKNQMTELLTGYGKIYTLFWDIPPHIEDKSLNELVRSLQPDILINDRGWDAGDFSTPERKVPDGNRFSRMTEACQSVGKQAWGYRVDEDYYSLSYLKSSIDKVMAMGGSYLLNVGPMANGKIPEKAADVIRKIGDWYNRLGGALENHEAPPFPVEIVRTPCIATQKNGKTYLHLYEGCYCSAVIFAQTPPSLPKKAVLLNDGRELRIRYGFLPSQWDEVTPCTPKVLSIADIPCDEFCGEPLVIELTY